jgi:hypothetical protein
MSTLRKKFRFEANMKVHMKFTLAKSRMDVTYVVKHSPEPVDYESTRVFILLLSSIHVSIVVKDFYKPTISGPHSGDTSELVEVRCRTNIGNAARISRIAVILMSKHEIATGVKQHEYQLGGRSFSKQPAVAQREHSGFTSAERGS